MVRPSYFSNIRFPDPSNNRSFEKLTQRKSVRLSQFKSSDKIFAADLKGEYNIFDELNEVLEVPILPPSRDPPEQENRRPLILNESKPKFIKSYSHSFVKNRYF